MNKEIKKILEDIDNKECYYIGTNGCLYQDLTKEELLIIKNHITNLQEENEILKELYRRTCNHLFNIGNDELARYFQAQINECNTFTVQGEDKNVKN